MKMRRIKSFLASFLAATMLFGNYAPYCAYAADEEIDVEQGDEIKNIDEAVSPDTESSEEDIVFTDETEWKVPAENWYEDYVYTIDGDIIYLHVSKEDKLKGNIVIPAKAEIDGKEYTVCIQPDYGFIYGEEITGIKIEEGVLTYSFDLFYGCDNLEELDISGVKGVVEKDKDGEVIPVDPFSFWYHQKIRKVNLSNVDLSCINNLNDTFFQCFNLEEVDLSGAKLPRGVKYLFDQCENLKSVKLKDIDTSVVEDMSGMFYGCESLTELDVTDFNTTNVSNMSSIFAVCKKLKNIDVSSFNTSNVTDMSGMFSSCEQLENIDVSNFITSNVTNMRAMFYSCKQLGNLDVSSFNTSNVTDMSWMFRGCKNLSELNLTGFNTSKVTDMNTMFAYCDNLKRLNVSGFDTKNVKDMHQMFDNSNCLTELDLSSFDMSGITEDVVMFPGITGYVSIISRCKNLEKIQTPVSLSINNVLLPSVFYDAEGKEYKYLPSGDDSKFSKELTKNKGTNNDPDPVDPEPDPISVSDNSPMCPAPTISADTTVLHLVKGQKFTLPDTGWESSNKKIISISKKGLLTVKKESATPIKLTKGEQSIDVYISKPSYTSKSITMEAGKTQDIGFNFDKDNLSVEWYSNAPDIATISENGMVKAVAKGTATITAYVNGSAYSCKVKVKESSVAVERTLHITINGSKSVKLNGVKKPVWTADDPSLVEIKGSKFKGVTAGETILRTKSGDNEYIIHLYIEDPVIKSGSNISAGKNKYNVSLKAGESVPIEFNYVDQDVVFKSNKGEIAYNDNGNIVANKKGKAKLTAKVNGKTITINVNVN